MSGASLRDALVGRITGCPLARPRCTRLILIMGRADARVVFEVGPASSAEQTNLGSFSPSAGIPGARLYFPAAQPTPPFIGSYAISGFSSRTYDPAPLAPAAVSRGTTRASIPCPCKGRSPPGRLPMYRPSGAWRWPANRP